MRLVSICPSNTELLGYLNLIPHLVGVDNDSTWPSTIQDIPKVGPDLQIDIQKVVSLRPDLVLASLSVPGMEKNIAQLEKENIPYIVLNPSSLGDVANDLQTVAQLTNKESKATEILSRYHAFIHHYKELAQTVEVKRSVYFEWWPKPVFTPGGTNWLTEISELCGATNIFSDKSIPSVQTDFSEVARLNPDMMFMVWVGVEEKKMNVQHFKKREDSHLLTAIKQNHLYTLEESLFCRPSPRLLVGMKKLASLIHPTIFPKDDGIDPLL